MIDPDKPCPCGTHRFYNNCCGPFHHGLRKPPTAEALMRSRYCAYVVGAVDYLVSTTYPAMRRTDLRNAYEATQKTIEWIGLEILETWQGTTADKVGKVEFKATYIQDGERAIHHELSRFRRYRGDWSYLDGQAWAGGVRTHRVELQWHLFGTGLLLRCFISTNALLLEVAS